MEATRLSVEFRERSGSRNWRLDVMIDGVASGHVDREGHVYRFFEGPYNEITWSFAEHDLEHLKARIRQSARVPLPC
jgi:hypothetical protein